MDSHKIRLLRSYSRHTLSKSESRSNSGSGLEKLLPRSSTPVTDDHKYLDDNNCFDPYELFRHAVESPMKRARVRGLKTVPYHFISGHLVQMDSCDLTTISFNITNEVKPKKKATMKSRFESLAKTVKGFFRRYYRILVRNKCDYDICPVTCECKSIKSFLNKTIVFDDAVQER